MAHDSTFVQPSLFIYHWPEHLGSLQFSFHQEICSAFSDEFYSFCRCGLWIFCVNNLVVGDRKTYFLGCLLIASRLPTKTASISPFLTTSATASRVWSSSALTNATVIFVGFCVNQSQEFFKIFCTPLEYLLPDFVYFYYHNTKSRQMYRSLLQKFSNMFYFSYSSDLFFRNDFNPIAVRVRDKINPHGRILKSNTSHRFVAFVEGLVLIGGKGQMKFLLS